MLPKTPNKLREGTCKMMGKAIRRIKKGKFLRRSTHLWIPRRMMKATMIFLAVMPLNAAFFNFLVPLQIGARDVAFPRINSFSLWTFVAGAFVLNFSWLVQALGELGWFSASGITAGKTDFVPAMGWFGYAPLTETQYTGIGTEFWIFGLQILGISSLSASMNFVAVL